MCRTLYPRQTRKKWFVLRYLYFMGWSFNQAEEPINWINMAYQSPEHSALCNCVKSVSVAGLPAHLQLIALQSIRFHLQPRLCSLEMTAMALGQLVAWGKLQIGNGLCENLSSAVSYWDGDSKNKQKTFCWPTASVTLSLGASVSDWWVMGAGIMDFDLPGLVHDLSH